MTPKGDVSAPEENKSPCPVAMPSIPWTLFSATNAHWGHLSLFNGAELTCLQPDEGWLQKVLSTCLYGFLSKGFQRNDHEIFWKRIFSFSSLINIQRWTLHIFSPLAFFLITLLSKRYMIYTENNKNRTIQNKFKNINKI